MTGIVFSKFARPSAGVIFSKHAIITQRHGAPYLMFRVANERGNDIIEASMHVAVLMDEVTPEGQSLRRFYDLELERSATPVLIMSWLVMHRIDEHSPLFGKSPQHFEDGDIRIMASLTGVDGTFMQTVYTYHQYSHVQIARDVEFHDVSRACRTAASSSTSPSSITSSRVEERAPARCCYHRGSRSIALSSLIASSERVRNTSPSARARSLVRSRPPHTVIGYTSANSAASRYSSHRSAAL